MKRANVLLHEAAQRAAQGRYGTGMVFGVLALAAVCAIIGGIFAVAGIAAWNGVALLAGGLGALVSVLQRMTSGTLKLDVRATRQMLLWLGAMRPVVGGLFGMAVFAILEGGLLPAITIPAGSELAFFAGVGFLAGFNERFAQDMLASSGRGMTTAAAPRHKRRRMRRLSPAESARSG